MYQVVAGSGGNTIDLLIALLSTRSTPWFRFPAKTKQNAKALNTTCNSWTLFQANEYYYSCYSFLGAMHWLMPRDSSKNSSGVYVCVGGVLYVSTRYNSISL